VIQSPPRQTSSFTPPHSSRILPGFFQGFFLDSFWDSSRILSGVFPGFCQDFARILPGFCQDSSRDSFRDSSWILSGIILGFFQGFFRDFAKIFPGFFQDSSRILPGIFQESSRILSGIFPGFCQDSFFLSDGILRVQDAWESGAFQQPPLPHFDDFHPPPQIAIGRNSWQDPSTFQRPCDSSDPIWKFPSDSWADSWRSNPPMCVNMRLCVCVSVCLSFCPCPCVCVCVRK